MDEVRETTDMAVIVERLAEAQRAKVIAKAAEDYWKRRALTVGRSLHAANQGDRWSAPDIGRVQLTNAGKPRQPVVVNARALAGHVAAAGDHALVVTTVQLPSDPAVLEVALHALRYWAGLDVTAEQVVPTAAEWLKRNAVVRQGEDGEWVVLQVTDSGTVPVPGVEAQHPTTEVRLYPEAAVKEEWQAAAATALADDLAAIAESEALAAAAVDSTGAAAEGLDGAAVDLDAEETTAG